MVVNKYPNDSIADNALYQAGYVRMREMREGSYDKASAQKAREAFEDFIYRYPQSEKVPQARENIKSLEGGVSKGSLDIAKYYDKMKQHKAAVIYYNDVIKQQPGTPDAAYAKNRIDTLKSEFGEEALKAGPELTENGARAQIHRKLQAKVDTISRPDYVGPPVAIAQEKIETGPSKPKLRTSPGGIPAGRTAASGGSRCGASVEGPRIAPAPSMKFALFLPLAAFFLCGCAGYHLGPVKPRYMAGINTVSVPAFKNDTLRPRVEVLLANALIKQIQQDGTYRVTEGNDSDAIVRGTVQQISRSPSRSVFGNVLLTTEYTLVLRCRFQVFRRSTGVLLDEREVSGQTSFFVNGSENIAADVNTDERQALPLAAEDLMVRYVSLLSEGW